MEAGLDLRRWILIQRHRTCASGGTAAGDGQRRRPAVNGGALAGAPRFRTRGLDFERPLHREMARATGRLARAAAVAEKRRGGRSARRRGLRSPARPPGHWGARAQQRTMRLGCSPPGAGLGRLRNDGAAAEARNQRRRRGTRVPASAALGGLAARARGSRVGRPGAAARFK
jgi:hypothetical protein